MKPTWPRVRYGTATAAVIAAAALLWHNLPTPDDVYGPFDVRAEIGEHADGRALTAQITGARIAPRIRKDRDRAPVRDAVGTWVIVDGSAMSTRTDAKLQAELIVGPNTYIPTERLDFMPLSGSLTPGIRVRSSWVFDVPADLVGPDGGRMTLRLWVGDGRMDSRLVFDIGLDDSRVGRRDFVRLEPASEAAT